MLICSGCLNFVLNKTEKEDFIICPECEGKGYKHIGEQLDKALEDKTNVSELDRTTEDNVE